MKESNRQFIPGSTVEVWPAEEFARIEADAEGPLLSSLCGPLSRNERRKKIAADLNDWLNSLGLQPQK